MNKDPNEDLKQDLKWILWFAGIFLGGLTAILLAALLTERCF